MAEQLTEFSFHNIELYKHESLGSGSYGGVCKAKCDGLLCAAKIMHPTLFDLHDPGTASYLRKFREECHLLSLARHPNVVQYLGTYTDPDTQLPVLLMELCDENLTSYLEKSRGPLLYHVQVNICNDIALALVYLHSNGLMHRDLTGKNILMVAGPQAKITDFGMSKLTSVNLSKKALTLCPGNVLYMSPEALDDAKSYSAKLDIFSFGVIVIQIVTTLFPEPGNRFKIIHMKQSGLKDDEEREVRELIPETERRQSHLRLISDSHALKQLALQCIKRKESNRPSAVQLHEKLAELKQSSDYIETGGHQALRKKKLEMQLQTKVQEIENQKAQIAQLNNRISSNDRQLQNNARQLLKQRHTIELKDKQMQAVSQMMQEQDSLLHQKQAIILNSNKDIETNEQLLNQAQGQLQASEHTVADLEEKMEQKDKLVTQLQLKVSTNERMIQELKWRDMTTDDQLQQQVATKNETPTAVPSKKRTKMWKTCKNAPEAMSRGSAVVHGNTAFIRPSGSLKIYSYHSSRREHWSRLPDNPNINCSLAVIDGLLTSLGGCNSVLTNELLSLQGKVWKRHWSQIFPPMATPCRNAACVTTAEEVIVAGGWVGTNGYLNTVEVLNFNTKQWSTVSPLPQKCWSFSATIHEDKIYLAGGITDREGLTNTVFTCSIFDLLQPTTPGSKLQCNQSKHVWREISDLPVTESTLVSFGGDLLAIGGRDKHLNVTTSHVYKYASHTGSWTIASQKKNKQSLSLAVTFSDNCIFVVGGNKGRDVDTKSNAAEIFE